MKFIYLKKKEKCAEAKWNLVSAQILFGICLLLLYNESKVKKAKKEKEVKHIKL